MMTSALATLVLFGFLVAAVWHDHRQRKIPNRIVAAGLCAALMIAAYLGGWSGLLTSVGGLVLGLILMFPFYVLRYLGAGDVKLIAMTGAFVGPKPLLTVIVYTMLAGGVLACLMLAVERNAQQRRSSPTDVSLEPKSPPGTRNLRSQSSLRLPYAWSVLIGACMSFFVPLKGLQ